MDFGILFSEANSGFERTRKYSFIFLIHHVTEKSKVMIFGMTLIGNTSAVVYILETHMRNI